MTALSGPEAVARLVEEYGLPLARAERAVRVAAELGTNVATDADYRVNMTVRAMYLDDNIRFAITPGVPPQG